MDTATHEDDGGKWDKMMEVCDGIVDRCWDIITEDAVSKKLTVSELHSIMQMIATAQATADRLLGPPDDSAK